MGISHNLKHHIIAITIPRSSLSLQATSVIVTLAPSMFGAKKNNVDHSTAMFKIGHQDHEPVLAATKDTAPDSPSIQNLYKSGAGFLAWASQ
jgi:hypothetical protein